MFSYIVLLFHVNYIDEFLKNQIEAVIHDAEEQSSFHVGGSCIDNVLCLKELHEKIVSHIY